MSDTLRMAFKEWASICEALGRGTQSIILRKGGIAEEKGLFTPDHTRFWLYPTYAHQQCDGVRPEALPLLEAVARRHDPGTIGLSHYVEVGGVFQVMHLPTLLDLGDLHLWSRETVEKRFQFREPGLFVLLVRVYRIPSTIQHIVKPEYDGCKTWVDLGEELPTDGSVSVLGEREYREVMEELDTRLNPRGVA